MNQAPLSTQGIPNSETQTARENRDLQDPCPSMPTLHAAHEAALEAARDLAELIPRVDSKMVFHQAGMAHPKNLSHAEHGTKTARKLLTHDHQLNRRRATTLLAATTAITAAAITALYGTAAVTTFYPGTVPEPTWWPYQYTWPSDLTANPLAGVAHTITAAGFAALTALNAVTALKGRWTDPATIAAAPAVAALPLPQLALLTTIV